MSAIKSLGLGRVTSPRAIVAALAVAVTLLAAPTAATPSSGTRHRPHSPSVFSNAKAGDTIRLASGNYGTFRGGTKSGMVTLSPEPRAHATMELDFNPAANITISRVTVTGGVITGGSTHHITIRSSNVPGQIWLDTRELQNADVVLANNDFHDWDTCSSCGEARVFLTGGSQPSGVTIRNSRFYGGLSDGIQNGSYGTKILGNEFYDITPGSPSGVHADAIQLYGSSHTVIRGNYMHDMPEVPFIMAPDGADHELIEDNVVEGSTDGYPYITLFSDDSSIVRHNTFADGACAFNIRCGVLRLSNKDSDDLGHGTVIEDNILGQDPDRGLEHDRPPFAQPALQRQPLGPGRDPGQAHVRRRSESTEPGGLPAQGWLTRRPQGERQAQHRGAHLALTPRAAGERRFHRRARGEGGAPEDGLDVVRLVAHLAVREPQRGEARSGVGLVALAVDCLLRRAPVVAQPIGLDHETQVGPIEVDAIAVHDLARTRRREAGPQGDRHKPALELGVGEHEGVAFDEPAKGPHPPSTGVRSERREQPILIDEPAHHRVVRRGREPRRRQTLRDVDQCPRGRGHGDARLHHHVLSELRGPVDEDPGS